MGKSKTEQYFLISGLNLSDNNRGTAALGYGAFSFIEEKHKTEELTPICLSRYTKPWKYGFRNSKTEVIKVGGKKINYRRFYVWRLDSWIYNHIALLAPLTKTARILKKVKFVAAINGGDGLSDIYGTQVFESRLFETNLAMKEKIPLIILPQTLGPFKEVFNLVKAEAILKYAFKVYVRDLKFKPELDRIGVSYELTKDLSYFMKPEEFKIDILPKAVGLNISGLCYSNRFRDLTGCFDYYPQLINRIIIYFQNKNIPVYLVSHSYNYLKPEETNDDMQAAREVYKNLTDKTNIYLIDKALTSPQTKYLISRFKFFIGSRMHANFAAIYTNTPVFGLAYSYKYEGIFDYMGLKGYYAYVINIKDKDIDIILSQINLKYMDTVNNYHKD